MDGKDNKYDACGIGPDQIRKELSMRRLSIVWVTEQKGDRSEKTRIFLVNNLMHIWVVPPAELMHLRDLGLADLQEDPDRAALVHWGMVSAVYLLVQHGHSDRGDF